MKLYMLDKESNPRPLQFSSWSPWTVGIDPGSSVVEPSTKLPRPMAAVQIIPIVLHSYSAALSSGDGGL